MDMSEMTAKINDIIDKLADQAKKEEAGKQLKDMLEGDLIKKVPDGRTLLSAGEDRYVRAFAFSDGKSLFAVKAHAKATYGCAWSPDGRTYFSCGADGSVFSRLLEPGP